MATGNGNGSLYRCSPGREVSVVELPWFPDFVSAVGAGPSTDS